MLRNILKEENLEMLRMFNVVLDILHFLLSWHGYYSFFQLFTVVLLVTFSSLPPTTSAKGFSIKEATVHDLQLAFKRNQLTSKQLVEFYLKQIQIQNPVLKRVLEVNPDAVAEAERADKERKRAKETGSLLSGLHGIPVLVKDNIASKDKLNTTAGSYALLGSMVPRDTGVVARLRKAGAIILGKASLSEGSHQMSSVAPSGWCARGGQGKVSFLVYAYSMFDSEVGSP
ncbi:probable amidase At4g34880 [Lotus japonicus]|uniref:probable amidase At4g34880 n=1 Tax=Lotus japonicus TaxID=34305 RepID=UPI002582BD4E|nr:probable amidase At4g34880 [Lotus japonicus]